VGRKKLATESEGDIEGVEVLNIRLPEDLILELDSLVERRVFRSRSEAIREFAREYVQEQTMHADARVAGQGGGEW
jgi:metal-responsive CopG/Arc/MetJ family transcriptional regulator